MRARRTRSWLAASVTAAALAGGLVAAPATAGAQTDFYTPPAELGGTPGEILRADASDLAIRVATPDGVFPAQGTRLMYRSSDTHGDANAVTGTYLEPSLPWHGDGPRPLVALAPGTQGQGDQCAPSKQLNSLITYTPPLDLFTEYELLSINAMLLQGIAVVVTDYEGLGTPGHHTYVNRKASGHALLDAARAARNLPGTSVSPDSPVGLWGYSQGGGAVASAAELQPTYAPELTLKGAYAGAPPADLEATLEQIDGTFLTGAIGYTVNGLADAYPELRDNIDSVFNDRGRQMLAEVANACVVETGLRYGFQHTSDFTNSGEPLNVVVEGLPDVKAALADQRIGRQKPAVPVLIQHGTQDDIVPYGQGRQLALDWCAQGVDVQFTPNPTPPILPNVAVNHVVPLLAGMPEAVSYLNDRFADRPAPNNCGAF
ncbi:lipase [Rhodococcus triatomae]|uniref:Secretory lipase n=1 Tax=Rhodococcus triatomae TaxID=300028 RepID=A0A1G8PFA8_9NOCA|nr:lipase family protein [Rhodococcus triatomae]QNG20084.1 lipase [Rhodococcus triatomae]QNG24000.1 lipase [Rhodococcus triatomae]SDI91016.1 Secretory lipase [Rhodococcus triatomae]